MGPTGYKGSDGDDKVETSEINQNIDNIPNNIKTGLMLNALFTSYLTVKKKNLAYAGFGVISNILIIISYLAKDT